MCGITGAIEIKNNSTLDFSKESDLHKAIANRGPDYYSNKVIETANWKISLAHSRLAIVDLSVASNQPMNSDNGRFSLTFNGEIYNYKEVRSELISLGCQFKTDGDTEVLLKAWEIWGEKCLDKLNGMFAFGVFDSLEQDFFLVRDRFGVKPLLYGFIDDNQFLFSSSIKALAKHISNEIDLEYCSNGLRFGYFEGFENASPFKKVKYVEPGTYIKFKLTDTLTFEKKQWYSLSDRVSNKINELANLSENELLKHGRNIFNDAVNIRLQCDVPVAVSLSGGVDSSAIASIAKQYKTNLTAFTYGSPNHKNSEGPIIEKFVKEKTIDIHYIYPEYSEKILGDIYDNTLKAQESPFLGLSIMAQHEVYKKVQEKGFKVLLGGQGGDEIFAGYRKFFLIAFRNALQKNNFSESFSFFLSLAQMLYYEANQYKVYWAERNRYLKKTGKGLFFLNELPLNQNDILGNTSLRDRQISDIQNFSIPTLLRYEDRNSMYFSIESRLPFMDYRIVEFALALTDTLKIKKGFGKWALRLMMTNEVPKYILMNRQKRGFDVTQDWINEGVGKRIISNVLENKNKAKDFVANFEEFEKMLTIENLNKSNFLNEAIVLDFLINPIKG